MTVGEMLARISSYELSEWREYYRLKAAEQARQDRKGGGQPLLKGLA